MVCSGYPSLISLGEVGGGKVSRFRVAICDRIEEKEVVISSEKTQAGLLSMVIAEE